MAFDPFNDPHAFAQEFKPTIWHRLGFGHAHVPAETEEEEQRLKTHGYAEGSLTLDTVVHFDWLDMLRLLISRRLSVAARTKCDVLPMRSVSASAVRVLPPGTLPPLMLRNDKP